MLSKILIANRGEIACRIIKTAQKLGIQTVAVYSEADRSALHVQMADEAYLLGPAPSQESYLKQERILEIAQKASVDAIHPGYGFLSENAEFAQKCHQSGFIFIGPPPEAIAAMGSKSRAKIIAADANVPLILGYDGDNQNPEHLKAEAQKIGYPIIIKASLGGGGKGMRIVEHESHFEEALKSAQREALSSFGNDHVILEKYFSHARHIEIQIFADQYGQCISLYERDCSMQRRHQKVIEEAPAPFISEDVRYAMSECAKQLAKKINYVGAGTLEFLFDGTHYYFMEMNTRLQVEHPVTEMITGLDLVEWQIRIAAGEGLPLTQAEVTKRGHAIEVRICAENPYEQFLPSIGQLEFFQSPILSDHARLDTGFKVHDFITPYYDSMLAKLIVWGETRTIAIKKLITHLQNFYIAGVKTNIEFLQNLLSHQEFMDGHLSTQFISQHEPNLLKAPLYNTQVFIAAVAFFIKNNREYNLSKNAELFDPYSPWLARDHWQCNLTMNYPIGIYTENEKTPYPFLLRKIQWLDEEKLSFEIKLDDHFVLVESIFKDSRIYMDYQDSSYCCTVAAYGKKLVIFHQGYAFHFDIMDEDHRLDEEAADSHLNAPMPGTIVAIKVDKGEKVMQGQILLVMEAMKMEHTLKAPFSGIVKHIHYQLGDLVQEGNELIELEPV